MAIYVTASVPTMLMESIKNSVDSKKIDTWEVDGDGDYTHVPAQWNKRAWLRPHVEGSRLIFGIIGRRNANLSKVEYAVYHGRFAEMLLTHFDADIKDIDISSLPDNKYDSIKPLEIQMQ